MKQRKKFKTVKKVERKKLKVLDDVVKKRLFKYSEGKNIRYII